MAFFLLIKRKGAKKPLGVIPARKGITKAKLRVSARQQIKKPFTFRILTSNQVKKLMLKRLKK